jgi:hypothetical protein
MIKPDVKPKSKPEIGEFTNSQAKFLLSSLLKVFVWRTEIPQSVAVGIGPHLPPDLCPLPFPEKRK